ncbi:S8 family serine peptidase [Natronosalvus rutilus]|uniref:S8 family serine peptidase n=1 Tax=Natronosalvus rutilus TaxID=2953753 RepID=A0A9E7N8C9_9EURY|nr:S8 family serine peptidase [Natronosalvus rutilus]UTF52746.1 S8 family serine peptidase [Natronosalvus rutilus]
MKRRGFLQAIGTLAVMPAQYVPLLSSPFGSDTLTASALELGSLWRPKLTSDDLPTFGSAGDLAWAVHYETDADLESLEAWISQVDGVVDLTHIEALNTEIIRAPTSLMGVHFLDRALGRGLASKSYVTRIEPIVGFERPEPLDLIPDQSEFDTPDYLDRRGNNYPLDGIAFETRPTTIEVARKSLGVNRATIPDDTEPVSIGVVDSGANVVDGRVFGRGQRGSPIRIAKGAHFTDTGRSEITVSEGMVTAENTTETDWRNAESFEGLVIQGFEENSSLVLSLDEITVSVATDTEWSNGTLTDTVVTNGTLELATDAEGNYLTSGTYESEWHDLGEEASPSNFTSIETLNSQTITYEFRSADDATGTNATAWQTDITALPNTQFLQVRITLETTDTTTTPTVDDYTSTATATADATYVGDTHYLRSIDSGSATLENVADVMATLTLEGRPDSETAWETIDEVTASGSGEHAFDLSTAGADLEQWRVSMTVTPDVPESATLELQAEQVTSPVQVQNGESDWDPIKDGNDHGTWCLSAMAADPGDDAYTGLTNGTDPELVVARALDVDGSGSTAAITNAIVWCTDQGVDVLNLSLGSYVYSETLADAIEYFYENGGSAVVAAAGNDRQVTRTVNTPASLESVIAANATTNSPPSEARVSNFGNVGPSDGVADLSDGKTHGVSVDVAAPGMKLEALLATTGSTRTRRSELSGTSMASPLVAALVAILLAAEPSLKGDHEAVRERLLESCEPIPKAGETEVGAGMPQLDRLLEGDPPDETQVDVQTSAADSRDTVNRILSGNP